MKRNLHPQWNLIIIPLSMFKIDSSNIENALIYNKIKLLCLHNSMYWIKYEIVMKVQRKISTEGQCHRVLFYIWIWNAPDSIFIIWCTTTFGWKVKLNIKDNKNVNKVIQYLNNKKEIVHQHINLKIGIVRSLTWMFPILVKSFWMFQPFKCLCCYIIVHKNIIIHKLRKSVFTSLCIAP